jgi:hypothetical protein
MISLHAHMHTPKHYTEAIAYVISFLSVCLWSLLSLLGNAVSSLTRRDQHFNVGALTEQSSGQPPPPPYQTETEYYLC